MRVADRLTQREASWRELERLVDQMSGATSAAANRRMCCVWDSFTGAFAAT